jgi:hypothetical protein
MAVPTPGHLTVSPSVQRAELFGTHERAFVHPASPGDDVELRVVAIFVRPDKRVPR